MKKPQEILQSLAQNGSLSVVEMAEIIGVSRQYLHRELNKLLETEQIIKLGSAPHVYYQLAVNAQTQKINYNLSKKQTGFLTAHFLIITELGQKQEGLQAMETWCKKQKLPVEKTVEEFISTREKYLKYYTEQHVINGLQKLQDTKGLDGIAVNMLYYLDFYAIERFGKTRLGTLMHFAKQGQNKILMQQIVAETKERIQIFCEKNKIDAVLYVPPTIKRELQIMKHLEKNLLLNLPTVGIRKVHNKIVMPQKALNKIHERVANAKMSFVITEKQQFKNILIIDDAIGSGSTINEIAKKLLQKNIAHNIIGLAITGSYKGFEVINEL
jgi:tryptophan synthase alpha subunit/DNA-binding transcriptional ArsR family regulator